MLENFSNKSGTICLLFCLMLSNIMLHIHFIYIPSFVVFVSVGNENFHHNNSCVIQIALIYYYSALQFLDLHIKI